MDSCGGSTTTTTTNASRSCYDADDDDDDDDETDLTTTTSNGTATAESSFCGVAAAALLDDLVAALLLENVTLRHENVEWRHENVELRIDNIALRRDLDEMRIELDRWEKSITAAVFANRRRYRPVQFVQTTTVTTTKRRQCIKPHQQQQQSGGADGGGGGKAYDEAQEVVAEQQDARGAGEKGDEVVVDHCIIYEAYTDRDMAHHHGTIDFAMDGTKDLADLLECDIVMNGIRYGVIRDDLNDLWTKAQPSGPWVPTTRRFGFVFGTTKTTSNNHDRNGSSGGGDRWYLEFTVLTTTAQVRRVVCSDPTVVVVPELEQDRGGEEATRDKVLELEEQGEKATTLNLARQVGQRGRYYVTHVHGQQQQNDFGCHTPQLIGFTFPDITTRAIIKDATVLGCGTF